MLDPIQREAPGTPGELKLSQLADGAFFGLWSYPSIHKVGGSAKQPIFKEVADLIVLFEDNIIIFSEKDKHFSASATDQVAWNRWARESIIDSADQLWAAEKYITRTDGPLFLDRRGERQFPLQIKRKSLQVHLVAVCRNVAAAKRQRIGTASQRSSGELSFSIDARLGLPDSKPFVVGDLNPGKTFVHVFDEEALDLVVNELDTVADFLHYLQARASAIRTQGLLAFDREGDLLASYLNSYDSLGFGSIALEDGADAASKTLVSGGWGLYVTSPAYADHLLLRSAAKDWKLIAARFSDAITSASVGLEAQDESLETHEQALRMWASENLLSRALLTQALFEKYDSVPTNIRSSRLVGSPCFPGRLYVFVFFPWHQDHGSYAKYRMERSACLTGYAHVAAYKYPQFKEFLVLGVDSKGSLYASETIMAMRNDGPLTAEDQRKVERVMRELRILTDFDSGPTGAKPHRQKTRPNDLCPCGSGVKFKRCCKVSS